MDKLKLNTLSSPVLFVSLAIYVLPGYASASSLSEVRERHILPRYRDLILRPPPLPPLESRATRAEVYSSKP